ncbi:MAG: TetR family transcriptional regulator [Hydrocarboniphaga sp.]|uniref:TetR/AcrR family transcriptional regulator n=1 Tax=Hydrocarboniphaga sp. TaxID=2033016 RepID=UPI0026073D91|nr:TetR/AcrR family transcriptional regulator [Hydrocarboniphaga sp.]MDB5968984.1 TetR family transcriptional regulator [Hydrocarboniphaga sp.]
MSPASEADRDLVAPDSGAEPTLERSRRIVEAAYELLGEAGLEGLTIRAVLKKTGLSRRAFYERFAGKDELMLAVFERTIGMAAEHFGEQIKVLPDPLRRLELIVTHISLGTRVSGSDNETSDRRGAAMSREHLRLAESHPAALQAALRPLLDLIAQQLSAGMAAGLVRHGAAPRLATLVYNLVSTTVHTELLSRETALPDPPGRLRQAADLWEFCRRAIAA